LPLASLDKLFCKALLFLPRKKDAFSAAVFVWIVNDILKILSLLLSH
jgi:hypothetical protein